MVLDSVDMQCAESIKVNIEELGGETRLGHPSGGEKQLGQGRFRNHERGRIHWSRAAGGSEMPGAKLSYYLLVDGPRVALLCLGNS
jgi:uncharacterized protein with LGFP repeats